MSGNRSEKLRAVFFAFVMVTSIAMAGVAFSGSAAAAPTAINDVSVTEGLTVRANDPGEALDISIDIETDASSDKDTFYIDVASLKSANVDFSSITDADVTEVSATNTVNSLSYNDGQDRIELEYTTDASSNEETIEIAVGDATPNTAALTGNQLGTAGVSPGASYTVSVVDDGGTLSSASTGSNSIDAAQINLDPGDLAQTGGSTDLGNDVEVGINDGGGAGQPYYDSDDASVTSGNVEATITVAQPELGNRSVVLDNTFTNGSTENLIEGDHDLFVQAGDLSDGTPATNTVETASADNAGAYTVNNLRVELDTPEGEVAGEDTVLYNSQQAVDGTIYRTSTNAPTQVIADDRVVYYEFVEPAGSTTRVAKGDTNNGQFSVSESWDFTSTSGGLERLDGHQYTVNIGTTQGEPPTGNTGSDTFTTLLDINYNIDGTPVENADVAYDDTVQISGSVQDGSGNAISDYRVVTAIHDDTQSLANVVKTGSTTTGNDGSFSFTFRYNDGFQDPQATSITGNDADALGVHLGTQLESDQANIDFADGTDHPVTRYTTVPIQPQNAQISVTADNNAPVNFEDTYHIQVTDEDGDVLEDQRVLVQGAFEGDSPFSIDNVPGNENPGAGDQRALEDVTGDGNKNDIVAFFAETDGDGYLNFTATPVESSFTVNATAEDDSLPTGAEQNSANQITIQAGNQLGQATIHSQPDAADADGVTFDVGDADPVNIVDEDVEDPQTANPQDGSGNPDVDDAAGNANFQSIFGDSGPEVVEVLPHADATSERIENETRLGYDANFDLDGITTYRVQFELRDESNTLINPNGGAAPADFNQMSVTGAGINSTVSASGGSITATGTGILDARYTDIDTDGSSEYAFLIQPTSVDEENPSIDHEIDVDGEDNVTLSLNTDGLEVAGFEVDGEPASEVQPQSTVDVTSIVEDATKGGDPINNGRVRLSQNGTELANFDARTSNTNDGEYSFSSVDVGDRGFDPDDDGIGEELSSLDFTAYQYADADGNQALEQNEVNKATVESLPIALDDSLQIDYVAEDTSKYSGFNDDGSFTLTRGVEYDQLAFELTDANGNAVNLTAGKNGNEVPLNTYATFDGNGDGEPDLINIQTDAGTPVDVRFDTAASDPGAGYYVISDVESVANANVSSGTSVMLSDGDSFVFGSDNGNQDNRANAGNGADTAPQEYVLNVETPDRSQATNASETGDFVTEDATVETEIAGVAGNAVPNSVNDTDNDGNLIDELNNDQSDWASLNTNTSAIETPTATVNRVYRLNATATDALGTPLNNSDFNTIEVDFDGSTDPVPNTNNVVDQAKFEMVADDDVSLSNDDGDAQPDSAATTTNDQVSIDNENGTFQFDIEVEQAGNDGVYTPVFEVEAQADTTAAPNGKSVASQSPTVQNPLVNVYGQNGGDLPISDSSGNQILANDLPNNLRVEAFPADENGFVLPNGLSYGLAGTFAEDNVGTTTQNINDVETSQLATEGYEEGQIGFFQATPTGTGVGFASLQFSGTTARDTNGNPVLFDVLSSNRGISLETTPAAPVAGENFTITTTDQSTFEPVDQTSVTIEPPSGDTATVTTDADGEAEVPGSFIDEAGVYDISTRRAGYADASDSFTVESAPEPDFQLELVDGPTQIVQNESFSATLSVTNEGDGAGTQDITYDLENDAGPSQLSATEEDVQLDAGASQEVTFEVAASDTDALSTGNYTHVFASDDDELTVDAEVVAEATIPEDAVYEPDSAAADFDANGDGLIQIGELGTAAADYANNDRSITELGEVAAAYANS